MKVNADTIATVVETSLHPQVRFGPGPDLSAETKALLRVRLRVLSAVLLGIVALLTLKGQLGQEIPTIPASSWGLLLVLLVATALLFSPLKLNLKWLHAAELVIFGASTAATLAIQYLLIQVAVASGDQALIAAQHQHMVLPFVLLIFLYALFVPGHWKRAAIVIGSIALSVVGLRILLVLHYPQLREILNLAQATQAGAFLLLAAASAVIGSHVINGMRQEAFKSRQLGQYELIEKLGSGGMGEVWTAHHRLLARPAAIKLIRPEMLGDQTLAGKLLERFEREALATAVLTSPHTITVYDFGITDDHSFYYVMELLQGFDLATLVKRWGPIPAGRVIYLISQACDSLAEAHSRGLIHRDIKPSNLFTCRIGNEADFVKVLDFGLVRSMQSESASREQLTQIGTVTGTPGFMSPEQITGKELDGRTDLYALGCVAYALLTAEKVFDGDGAMMEAIQHVQEVPVPPSQRVQVPIPGDLEEVVLWCLQKSPERRPPDAAVLKHSLLRCASAREWDQERRRSWWIEHASTSGGFDEWDLRTASTLTTRL